MLKFFTVIITSVLNIKLNRLDLNITSSTTRRFSSILFRKIKIISLLLNITPFII